MPNAVATGTAQNDDSPLTEIKENFQQWRAFWRTRKAILNGEPVFDYSNQDLTAKGVMGPWQFNAMQSLASAVTAGVVSLALRIVWPHTATDLSTSADKVQSWLSTGLAPFSLLMVANLVAWASLWKEDHDKGKRKRAARAYLYYDAAYGFLPQCLLGIGSTFTVGIYHAWRTGAYHGADGTVWKLIMIGGLVWGAIWIWQGHLTSKTFPSKLFSLHGYSPCLPRLWRLRRKIENPGPYRLYRLVTFTAVPSVLATLHFGVVAVSSAAGFVWDKLVG